MKTLSPEKALVSQAGALIQMKKQLAKASGTNFVPRHMRTSMPGTMRAVETILEGFRTAMAEVHAEAQGPLAEWCGRLGLLTGSILGAKLMGPTSKKYEHLEVEGPIMVVQLHDELVDQQRVVEIWVQNLRIYHCGRSISEQEVAKDLEALSSQRTLVRGEAVDPATGITVPVFKFHIGITPESRRKGRLRDVELV